MARTSSNDADDPQSRSAHAGRACLNIDRPWTQEFRDSGRTDVLSSPWRRRFLPDLASRGSRLVLDMLDRPSPHANH
jgi:hypothetical protein